MEEKAPYLSEADMVTVATQGQFLLYFNKYCNNLKCVFCLTIYEKNMLDDS